ncbi:GTP-binding protein [Protomyces lactucae-debilis]|uniref:GTP-binding protein n=1 Tax=Protomyces lactucae-debilis TaxID=2754530 RepID=A0A1Y2FT90_PROLT|nr:GTP-binding protein [Protomyces lactucae-debilis]ORY87159.1 GTP-binding protein [Protomyces lactucae-debilis]
MGLSLKKKSRRQPVRQRHRVTKKVAEHNRKTKKADKKDVTWKSKLKKDPGIPASFPYKDRLLAEIEDRKREAQQAKLSQREEQRAAKRALKTAQGDSMAMQVDGNSDSDSDEMSVDDETQGTSLADFAASIAKRNAQANGSDDASVVDGESTDQDEEWTGFDASESALKKETSRKMFDKDFKQVVEDSDVILYIVDARDPEGTRSREVEKMVLNAARGEKRLILVLNKIDLVPPPVLNGWLAHLRESFPTLPIKASKTIASHAYNHKSLTTQSTAAALLKSLKAYSQKRALKRSITVGVVGFPNTGKSSVINALLSRTNHNKAGPCVTGSEAGVTRSVKELKLDSKIRLLDSPGIVFPASANASQQDDQARLVLMNAIPSNQIVDPIPAATLILERLSSNQQLFDEMVQLYSLPAIINPGGKRGATDFLVQVARKRGRLGKGGIPDLESAARLVVNDWCDGRLVWYTQPPVETSTSPSHATNTHVKSRSDSGPSETQLVSNWAAEFDLGDLLLEGTDD